MCRATKADGVGEDIFVGLEPHGPAGFLEDPVLQRGFPRQLAQPAERGHEMLAIGLACEVARLDHRKG